MKKKTIPLAGNATKALLLLSLLLIASAVFLSQSDKLFAKAASSNIRGTMVLADKPSFVSQGYPQFATTVLAPVALPGTTCRIVITGCSSVVVVGTYTAHIPDIYLDDQLKATGGSVPVSPGVASGTCQSTPTIENVNGGLHAVKIQLTNLPTSASAYPIVSYAAVAYDCTP